MPVMPSNKLDFSHRARQFDELALGGDHVGPAVVAADREKVVGACAVVKGYVDKHLAHIDAHGSTNTSVKVGDVHGSVATIYDVFHRWYQLLTNVVLGVPLVEPWEETLTIPWITEAQASEIFSRRSAEAEELENRLLK